MLKRILSILDEAEISSPLISISAAAPYHRTSAPNYKENKWIFREISTALRHNQLSGKDLKKYDPPDLLFTLPHSCYRTSESYAY
jgi:hypothetical protein